MRTIILGAQGMLGQAVVKEFQNSGYETIGWDREEIDITDKDQVEEKIKLLSPHIIINCAAYNDVDGAEKEDRELAMKINGEAVSYLAQAAVDVGAIFVHYSTDYVFKGDRQEGYKEDDEPEPQSWYAKSKYYGEQKLINLSAYKLINFYLIRTSRLFGSAGPGKGAKESFVDLMLRLGKERREVEAINEEVSSPTYAPDLAKATFELLASSKPWGIYHRTNDGACAWYGWAKKIFELAGRSVEVKPVPGSHFPRSAPRPRHSVLISTKLPPLRRWEEALAEYLGRRGS